MDIPNVALEEKSLMVRLESQPVCKFLNFTSEFKVREFEPIYHFYEERLL